MFQVGDRVKVLPNFDLTNPAFHNLEGEVVEVGGSNAVMVKIPKHPAGLPSDYSWSFNHTNERLELISRADKEKPCQVCGRKNDIGVTTCWLCGEKPF